MYRKETRVMVVNPAHSPQRKKNVYVSVAAKPSQDQMAEVNAELQGSLLLMESSNLHSLLLNSFCHTFFSSSVDTPFFVRSHEALVRSHQNG